MMRVTNSSIEEITFILCLAFEVRTFVVLGEGWCYRTRNTENEMYCY